MEGGSLRLGCHHGWVLMKVLFWVTGYWLLAPSYGGKRARELWVVSFIRTLISFMRAPSSRPNHFPKAPCPNTITVGVRILSSYEFGSGGGWKKHFGLPRWLSDKESTCQCRRRGWGRSPGEGNGNPLQCFCLKNFMDKRAWWGIVHQATKSQQ